MHGGTCENTAPDAYQCTCADGLSGTRCEIVEHPCATKPCRNGGTCALKEKPKFEPMTMTPVNGSSSSNGDPSLDLQNSTGGTTTTTTIRVVRGMQGMSSMGKPKRPPVDVRSILLGHAQAVVAAAEADSLSASGGIGVSVPMTTMAAMTGSAAGAGASVGVGSSSAQSLSTATDEFTCACATGWTGPTCEISEYYL